MSDKLATADLFTDATSPIMASPMEEVVTGQFVRMNDMSWYKIANCHLMNPFFMSGISASDHWMFLDSRGALTAGRQNSESSLFPYYSADKISDLAHCTGPKTLLEVFRDGSQQVCWEPFSSTPSDRRQRSQNLYKSEFGNRILFEEINHSLKLAFRYCWTVGQRFGFIRRCEIVNLSEAPTRVRITDGFVNLLPSQLGHDFQLRYSNLADAYKKNELLDESGLAVFYLSSVPTDRAEPSEGLRATVAWQFGLAPDAIALSDLQMERVRSGMALQNETDVRGQRGAYLFSKTIDLEPLSPKHWYTVADVNRDHSDIVALSRWIQSGDEMSDSLEQDAQENENKLMRIISAADGRQASENQLRVQRHQSNVMFNVMRGGIPAGGYELCVDDFREHVKNANQLASERNDPLLSSLDAPIHHCELQKKVAQTNDADLIRIASEYLPLCFSRRHGDPTRPWNRFSIDIQDENDRENLSYEGNWRDIFQNWEALSLSFPLYTPGMVFRFVNASTADGYNPYRVTKDGFEWEEPDPNDPWSNIGYWGDHQIIYLLKLLERCHAQSPKRLTEFLARECCAYADIPYRIRSYQAICDDPQETIEFDQEHSDAIAQRVASVGADGKLLWSESGKPYHVCLMEKLLVPILTKLTNFVPGGGIWLNTQRPEWNDANNALVGRGLSVVTVCYLRRYLTFMIRLLSESDLQEDGSLPIPDQVPISRPVAELAEKLDAVLTEHAQDFSSDINDEERKQLLDELSMLGCQYRTKVYAGELSREKSIVSVKSIVELFRKARAMADHTIRQNRRDDGMYHSYNLMHLEPRSVRISTLYEMLEGQVAVLSSGLLTATESLEVLDSLRQSRMYRADQQSYMLYPNRDLPRFLEKNTFSLEQACEIKLVRQFLDSGDTSIVRQDVAGNVHFNGDFRNVSDLNAALNRLTADSRFKEHLDLDRSRLCELFESIFGHQHFTGRSGTFFGYEGLGSIYWHMVSKLSLAVIEQSILFSDSKCSGESREEDQKLVEQLHEHYELIRDGIGLTKSPLQYGAFPTDAYSHTPLGAGAQQPGMTGQVKEDILSRWDELGIRIDRGRLWFEFSFFEASELLQQPSSLDFVDVLGEPQTLKLAAGSFAMTICNVPIVYTQASQSGLTIHYNGMDAQQSDGLTLSREQTESLFARLGEIERIDVQFDFR